MAKEKEMKAGHAKEEKGFMKWYNSPAGKRTVGIFYSVGAAVVIVGALFKIQHWPGAGFMLTAGMGTEVLLFLIGILDKPHPEYHWDHVFPALVAKESNPMDYNNMLRGGNGGNGENRNTYVPNPTPAPISNQGNTNTTATAQDRKSGGGIDIAEAISGEDAKKLTDNIKRMNETAEQLVSLGNVAELTDKYAKNVEMASEAVSKFTTKQQSLHEAADLLMSSYNGIAVNMTSAQVNTKAFVEKADEVSRTLGSINTAYELQLKEIQKQMTYVENQSKAIDEVTGEVTILRDSVRQSVENMNTYKTVTDRLAKNVAELNDIYGNMLNAARA